MPIPASETDNYIRAVAVFILMLIPSFNDTQIDTQTLVAGGQFMSPMVIGLKSIKIGKTIGNTGENHEESFAVTEPGRINPSQRADNHAVLT
jgi:hypothetical protein